MDKIGSEDTTDKENELTRNDNQYIVHGADGPFLMDKSRWPKMILTTEQESQDQEGMGVLTCHTQNFLFWVVHEKH
jgi:hypothetical protein